MSALINTIIIYILLICIIVLIKPEFIYSYDKNEFKQFGCREDQTLFTLPIVGLSLAFILYFIFTLLELVNS